MKNIILIVLALILFSCGKNPSPDESHTASESDPMAKRSQLDHHLPQIKFKNISDVNVHFENENSRKRFSYQENFIPKQDYLRKKILYNHWKDLKENTSFNSSGLEKKSILKKIDNNDYHIFLSDLVNQRKIIENDQFFKGKKMPYKKGNFSFKLNLSFENLKNIIKLEDILIKIDLIDIKTWKKKEIAIKRLVRSEGNSDIIVTHQKSKIHVKNPYFIQVNNVDERYLRDILTGEFKIGLSLFDLSLSVKNNISGGISKYNYQESLKDFFEKRSFLYFINNKKTTRLFKLPEEKIKETLKFYFEEIEFSKDKRIQYLKGQTSSIDPHSTFEQLMLEPIDSGAWKVIDDGEEKSSLLFFLKRGQIVDIGGGQKTYSYKKSKFNHLSLKASYFRQAVIISKGITKTPIAEESIVTQSSVVSDPDVCERNFEHKAQKLECYSKNLRCQFVVKKIKNILNIRFGKSHYQNHLNLLSVKSIDKKIIEDEWYSSELGLYFTIINLQHENEINIKINEKIKDKVYFEPIGVIKTLNCPSLRERGFRLPGQTYPSVRSDVAPKIDLGIEIKSLQNDY